MTGAFSLPPRSGTDTSARTWQYAMTAMFTVVGVAGAAWFSRIPAVRDMLQASTAEVALLLLSLSVGSLAGIAAASRIAASVSTKRALAVTLSVLSLSLWVPDSPSTASIRSSPAVGPWRSSGSGAPAPMC